MDRTEKMALNAKKTGDTSPMLRRHNIGITKNGLIDARHATVYFDFDFDQKKSPIQNVCVAYCPREVMTQYDFDVWCYWDTWDAVMGNCCSGWPNGGGGLSNTPTGLFGELLACQFANHDELIRAIKEFGRIKQCAWARQMLW